MNHFKYRAALTLALLFTFFSIAYAQIPAPPLSHIDFAGMRYDLLPQGIEESFTSSRWQYQPTLQLQGAQQSHYQELVLYWTSDEGIFDTHDEKSCPDLKDEPIFNSSSKDPSWFVTYSACDELSDLRDKEASVIHVRTDQREIVVASIIRGGDVELEYVTFTLSRYIPVPIPHYDHINSMLRYAYTITAYGSSQEEAVMLLERLMNQEGEQWLTALLAVPVPQFILDKARYYKDCRATYGSKSDENCP